MVAPYANITFIDAYGVLYKFNKVVDEVPKLGKAVLPHPRGIDTEKMLRLIRVARQKSMKNFLTSNFQRVGNITAKNFLKYVNINPDKAPNQLVHDEIVRCVQGMNSFEDFLSPETKCLSPIGEAVLEAGIKKELEPKFIASVTRKPQAYSGHPFVVEVAMAFGGNKIESSSEPTESISDRPELEREMRLAMQVCARKMRVYLSRIEREERSAKRASIFEKYLPYIAQFATKLSGKKQVPPTDFVNGGKKGDD